MKNRTKKIALFTSFLLLGGMIGSLAVGLAPKVVESDATSPTPCPESYYSECEGLSGSSLSSKLVSINSPKSPSYDWSRYEDADEALDDNTSILSIYTRHNIKKSNHCGDYAWDKWNREHVWTQSAWPQSASDNHNIFACEGKINGIRNNYLFNEVEHTSSNQVTVFNHATDCYFDKSYFEPCDEAKGEIARSVMYGAVMYSRNLTSEIKSVELALKWHLEHPNTERDIRRNNIVHTNQGNRNPFVDHPEYACKIWGQTNEATKKLCGSSPTTPTLTKIEITTENYRTFFLGDEFVGEEVTATYSDGSTGVVNATFSGYNSQQVGTQTITASYSEGSITKTATYQVTVEDGVIHVTSVSVTNGAQKELKVGETHTIEYSVLPTSATNKSVTFESSDTAVATVSSNGVVTAKKTGNCDITVKTVDGEKTAKVTINVSVVHVENITTTKETIELEVGDSETIEYTVLPVNAADKSVTFESSNSGVAEVNESGKVVAKGVGDCYISIIANDGGVTKTVNVVVNPTAVESVTLNAHELTLLVDDSVKLIPTIEPTTATNKNVTFTSSDKDIVSVQSDGTITALDIGTASITVTTADGGFTDSCEVTVAETKIDVESVSLDKTSLELIEGESDKLVATILPENATNKAVTWSSDDEDVVTVDTEGNVTARSPGSAIVTVETVDGGEAVTCLVTVSEIPFVEVESVNISTSKLTLYVGETKNVKIKVLPENATNKELSVNVDDSSVATVSEDGLVTALKAGTTDVEVKSKSNESAKDTFKITVKNNQEESKLVALEIATKPSKLVYQINDGLNLDGLKLQARYLDGKTKFVDPTTIGTLDTSTAGRKEVKFTYTEINTTVSASLDIKVVDKTPISLSKSSNPIKKEYYADEPLNPYGLKVFANYDDGSKEDVTDFISTKIYAVSETRKDVFIHYLDLDALYFSITILEGEPTTQSKARDYSLSFLEDTDQFATINDITMSSWEILESKFNNLDYNTKSYYKNYKLTQSTNEVGAISEDEIKKVVELYDQTVIGRTLEGFKDFMERNPKAQETVAKNFTLIPTILKYVLWSMVGIAGLVTFIRIITKHC